MGSKDTQQLLALARRRGYTTELNGTGHWRITARNGAHVTIPGSPRSGKCLERSRAALRRLARAATTKTPQPIEGSPAWRAKQ